MNVCSKLMKRNLEHCKFVGVSGINIHNMKLYCFLQYTSSWEKQHLYVFKNDIFITYHRKGYTELKIIYSLNFHYRARGTLGC